MTSLVADKVERSYSLASPPHLRAPQSSAKIFWHMTLFLGPIWGGAIFFFGWAAIRVLFLVVTSAFTFEFVFRRLTGVQARVPRAHGVLVALLFAFLLPPTISWQAALVGSFAAVVVGRDLFGGLELET